MMTRKELTDSLTAAHPQHSRVFVEFVVALHVACKREEQREEREACRPRQTHHVDAAGLLAVGACEHRDAGHEVLFALRSLAPEGKGPVAEYRTRRDCREAVEGLRTVGGGA
jgi:hypothetical protein